MFRSSLLAGFAVLCSLGTAPASAQITLLDSFNPSNTGGLCSVAIDATSGNLWVYGCSAAGVEEYATDGTFLGSIPRPGEPANDVDLDFTPATFTLAGTLIPSGTLLFINGETGPAEVYALDETNGNVIESLSTAFGGSHVVGGAYHPARGTLFLVQDMVPPTATENLVGEVDPVTGAVLNQFQTTAEFAVNFGDLEVCVSTGNLLIVSSNESTIAEYAPTGTFVAEYPLPGGVTSLAGIAIDEATGEAWVASTSGTLHRLGNMPCGATPVPIWPNRWLGMSALLGTLGLLGATLTRRRALRA